MFCVIGNFIFSVDVGNDIVFGDKGRCGVEGLVVENLCVKICG